MASAQMKTLVNSRPRTNSTRTLVGNASPPPRPMSVVNDEPQVLLTTYYRELQALEKSAPLIDAQALRQKETAIVENSDVACSGNVLNIDPNKVVTGDDVKKAIAHGYEDSNILTSVLCLNNHTLNVPYNLEMSEKEKIRTYISRLKQIGSESVGGYAMISELEKQAKDVFIVKSPRDISGESYYDQIHEYIVGTQATNNLRNLIPNFSYVLGHFTCSPPFLKVDPKEKLAVTYCQNDDPKNQTFYLIYEFVKNSVSLRDFIKKGCTEQQYLNVFVQILFALDLAQSRFKFTHNDLHDDNVLIKKLDKEIVIPYKLSTGKTWYLKTDTVATFIDYGRSYIETMGPGQQVNRLGWANQERLGVYPDRPNYMYDISKLIMFSAASSLNGFHGSQETKDDLVKPTNPAVYNTTKQLSKGLYNNVTNDFANYIKEMAGIYYAYPYFAGLKNYKAANFFEDHVEGKFMLLKNFLMSSKPSYLTLYGCENKNTCMNSSRIQQKFTTPVSEINDPYTFYSVFDSHNTPEIRDLAVSKYTQFMDTLIQDADNNAKKMQTAYNYINTKPSFFKSKRTEKELMAEVNVEVYRRYFNFFGELFDLQTENLNIQNIMEQLNYANEDINTNRYYNEAANNVYTLSKTEQEDVLRKLDSDLSYIRGLLKTTVKYRGQLHNQAQLLSAKYPYARWIFKDLIPLYYAIAPQDQGSGPVVADDVMSIQSTLEFLEYYRTAANEAELKDLYTYGEQNFEGLADDLISELEKGQERAIKIYDSLVNIPSFKQSYSDIDQKFSEENIQNFRVYFSELRQLLELFAQNAENAYALRTFLGLYPGLANQPVYSGTETYNEYEQMFSQCIDSRDQLIVNLEEDIYYVKEIDEASFGVNDPKEMQLDMPLRKYIEQRYPSSAALLKMILDLEDLASSLYC